MPHPRIIVSHYLKPRRSDGILPLSAPFHTPERTQGKLFCTVAECQKLLFPKDRSTLRLREKEVVERS
jgi:hypothetical protein